MVVPCIACGDFCVKYFAAPVVTHSEQVNGPTTGGVSVTMSGVNFGVSNLTPTAQIMLTLCATTSWSSTTGLVCAGASGGGVGALLGIAVTASSLVGSDTGIFTFDCMFRCSSATLSFSLVCYPRRICDVVVSAGCYICGDVECCGQWRGCNSAGRRELWRVRLDCLRQDSSDGVRNNKLVEYHRAFVHYCGRVGGRYRLECASYIGAACWHRSVCADIRWCAFCTLLCLLDCDFCVVAAPVVTHTDATNGPASGGTSVTLSGVNIGESDVTATVQVMATLCTTTSWTSTTGIVCNLAVGSGIGATWSVQLTASGLVGTNSAVFSYDGAVSLQRLCSLFLLFVVTVACSAGRLGCECGEWACEWQQQRDCEWCELWGFGPDAVCDCHVDAMRYDAMVELNWFAVRRCCWCWGWDAAELERNKHRTCGHCD